MAKYDVKMSCGHVEQVELFGPGTDRERKIAWYENHGLCKQCYQERTIAEAAEKGLVEVEVLYRDYKDKYSGCKTKPNSYNPKAKTIIIYVTKDAAEKIANRKDIHEVLYSADNLTVAPSEEQMEQLAKAVEEGKVSHPQTVYNGCCNVRIPKNQEEVDKLAAVICNLLLAGVEGRDITYNAIKVWDYIDRH